nr:MAG TPA: PGC7/Stella/Dppa3 domain protein [Caudoviricetes sp.]
MGKVDVGKIKCDCRYCLRAGPVENFMCYCPIHGCNRSVGVRMCLYFLKRK